MRIYVAGPMSNYEDFNFPAFHAAAAQLRAMGYDVISPAENFGGDQGRPYMEYIEEGVRQITRVDGVALLPGWTASQGALVEQQVALMLGRKVARIDYWLREGAAREKVA